MAKSDIKYEKTKIKGIGRCGMCKNVEFCVNQLGITDGLSKFCMFKPSQFKPREGFKHNDDCYFYVEADRYHDCLCGFDASVEFNCLECNKFISRKTAHAIIRKEVMKRRELNDEEGEDNENSDD